MVLLSYLFFKKLKDNCFIYFFLSCNFYFYFLFISWRLITLQYCSGFCHTLKWISHEIFFLQGKSFQFWQTLVHWYMHAPIYFYSYYFIISEYDLYRLRNWDNIYQCFWADFWDCTQGRPHLAFSSFRHSSLDWAMLRWTHSNAKAGTKQEI